MKNKYYFENEESEQAHSEAFFKNQMKDENISEMIVIEAIKVPHYKSDFVYCMEMDTCYNKNECGSKSKCESYKPNTGVKGRCEYMGIYCEFGEEVIFKNKLT